ncbi:hypothetical protein Q3G72_031676 [Acer saccharum]|nr:hypothetical protein Q3G72_031676 [Acer saccharum]
MGFSVLLASRPDDALLFFFVSVFVLLFYFVVALAFVVPFVSYFLLDEAKKQFGVIEGSLRSKPVEFYSLKFEECWKILKDTSKWNAYLLERNQPKKPKKTTKPNEQTTYVNNLNHPTSTSATPAPVDEDVLPNTAANLIRPEGRQKAKAKRKKESKDDDASAILKSINETLKEAAEIEKEKYKARKKRT